MNIASEAPALSPLFLLRTISPTLVLLSALSIAFTRPSPPQSPSPITPVVVASHIPRRATILSLLSLAGLTFFLDGLTTVIYAVLRKVWPHYTGLEINAVIGLAAFAGLAAIGAWKDVQGVDVWSLRRLQLSILVAFALDLAQVILSGESLHGESHCLMLRRSIAHRARAACDMSGGGQARAPGINIRLADCGFLGRQFCRRRSLSEWKASQAV